MDSTYQETAVVRTDWELESGPKAASAVAWGAIVAGAAGAAALSLILLILGTGLGLSSVSPWVNDGVSAGTLGLSTIAWLTFTHLAASGMGGYLAGRLRTRWLAVNSDEVYFRDTAHGFLAWSVATLVTAVLLTSVIGSIISGGAKAGASVMGGLATATAVSGAAIAGTESPTAEGNDAISYFTDSLFRKEPDTSSTMSDSPALPMETGGQVEVVTDTSEQREIPTESNTRRSAEMPSVNTAEIRRIIVNSVMTGELPADDLRYVSQVVADETGLSQQAAETRVKDTYNRLQTTLHDAEIAAKDAADKARKASAYAALWLFVSLLIGAFMASWMATFGGRLRDT